MMTIEKSSGNVFADIGFPDADLHLQKAHLVARIQSLIDARKLTQVAAAKRLGMSQPDVSKMLRGHFQTMTIDRLMRCLLALGDNIEISIGSAKPSKRKTKTGARGILRVVAA